MTIRTSGKFPTSNEYPLGNISFKDIAFGNGKFVVVCGYPGRRCYLSDDGIHWRWIHNIYVENGFIEFGSILNEGSPNKISGFLFVESIETQPKLYYGDVTENGFTWCTTISSAYSWFTHLLATENGFLVCCDSTEVEKGCKYVLLQLWWTSSGYMRYRASGDLYKYTRGKFSGYGTNLAIEWNIACGRMGTCYFAARYEVPAQDWRNTWVCSFSLGNQNPLKNQNDSNWKIDPYHRTVIPAGNQLANMGFIFTPEVPEGILVYLGFLDGKLRLIHMMTNTDYTNGIEGLEFAPTRSDDLVLTTMGEYTFLTHGDRNDSLLNGWNFYCIQGRSVILQTKIHILLPKVAVGNGKIVGNSIYSYGTDVIDFKV